MQNAAVHRGAAQPGRCPAEHLAAQLAPGAGEARSTGPPARRGALHYLITGLAGAPGGPQTAQKLIVRRTKPDLARAGGSAGLEQYVAWLPTPGLPDSGVQYPRQMRAQLGMLPQAFEHGRFVTDSLSGGRAQRKFEIAQDFSIGPHHLRREFAEPPGGAQRQRERRTALSSDLGHQFLDRQRLARRHQHLVAPPSLPARAKQSQRRDFGQSRQRRERRINLKSPAKEPAVPQGQQPARVARRGQRREPVPVSGPWAGPAQPAGIPSELRPALVLRAAGELRQRAA